MTTSVVAAWPSRLLVVVVATLLAAPSVLAAPPHPTSRDWRTWPFSRTSPWNMPIGRNAQYAAIPASRSWALGVVNYGGRWASSVGIARPTDPLVDVLINRNRDNDNFIFLARGGQNCRNSAAVDATIRHWAATPHAEYYPINPWSTTAAADFFWEFPRPPIVVEPVETLRTRVHKPAGLCPSPDRDSHIALFQPDGRVLDSFGTIVLGDGDVVAHRVATMVDARGPGTAVSNGRRASMLPTFAGLIRDGEIASGAIRHALSVSAPAWMLRREARWPAAAFDRNSGYSGQLPMGSLLAIPQTVDLTRLGLSANGLVVAQALQHYGAYVVDRGGWYGVTIKSDTNIESGSWPSLPRDEAILRSQLRWVVNHSRETMGGGGARITRLAPPFADDVPGRPHYDLPDPARPIWIDSGSAWAFVDSRRSVWWHDQWYVGGTTRSRRTTPIAGTVDDAVYQTERADLSGYRIPLRNGLYTVKLHFAETDPYVRSPGRRVTTARVETQTRAGIDPYRAVGRNAVLVETFSAVRVDDRVLDIVLTRTAALPTQINGVEIVPLDVPDLGLTLTASATNGVAPLSTTLRVVPTNCGGGCSVTWELGDGSTAGGGQVTHRYAAPGLYTVLATVAGNGQVARAVIDITVR